MNPAATPSLDTPAPRPPDDPWHALHSDLQILARRHRGVQFGINRNRWMPNGVTTVHLMLIAVMLVWAKTMWTSDDPFATSTIMRLFPRVWPYTPFAWGFVFMVAALVGIAGLLTPPARRLHRLHLAGCLSLCHFGLATITYLSGPDAPGWLIYTVFLVASIWRIAAEAYLEWRVL